MSIVASTIGGISGNAVICVLSILVIWAMTRQWWLATLPLVALNLHIGVHIVTSTLIARDRPSVQQLDVGQPTASFPSGHMGATTAQLLVMALFFWYALRSLALRMAIAACFGGYLLVLAWSRVYPVSYTHLPDGQGRLPVAQRHPCLAREPPVVVRAGTG